MSEPTAGRRTGVLIDTNLLVRLAKSDDPQRPTAERALANLAAAGRPIFVVPQCLYEFHAVATRPLKDNGLDRSAHEAEATADFFLGRFTLLKDERGVFTHWRELVRRYSVRGKPTHDGRLVAAMRRHGLTRILTFNGKDFARYDDLAVLDPAAVAAP